MRVIFMGSPAFSVAVLKTLHAHHEIIAVYSQPPRPKGRGQGVEKTAVHQAAEELGLTVRTPDSLNNDHEIAEFRALNADVAIVAAYGLILRPAILTAPKYGCINIHASLLPRWRGAAPIQRAIEAGDKETGITIMQMDEGLDTGAMLLMNKVPIGKNDTAQTIHDALSTMGAALIVTALEMLEQGQLYPQAQPEEGVTYAKKLEKSESKIDWTLSAPDILKRLRAFTPWPGLWMRYKGERLKIHQAEVVVADGVSGTVIGQPLVIACGDQALSIQAIQREGRNRQSIDEFCRGSPVTLGEKLG